MEGYMLAGRNVGLAFGMATVMATWVTSNTTMLAPQFALELGVWGMLAHSTGALGLLLFAPLAKRIRAIGKGSCRYRVCQYVSISVVDVSFNKNTHLTLNQLNH